MRRCGYGLWPGDRAAAFDLHDMPGDGIYEETDDQILILTIWDNRQDPENSREF